MTKILLLILVVAVVWRLAKGSRGRTVGSVAQPAPERMVSCQYCGLYLPQGEAIGEGSRYYCCAEHRRLAG